MTVTLNMLRIVGESPANSLEKTVININLPEDIDSAMEQIYVDNPQISSYESRVKIYELRCK